MNLDVVKALKKSTGRAKSDVANKIVSMLLHEVSRKACEAGGMLVSDGKYTEDVLNNFSSKCIYCGTNLEVDRSSVEHLNGMNRFRLGLHVPGNVAMSCKRCNNEKRRDDQNPNLTLAANGWESFLSHDGEHCDLFCKTCLYWESIWPDNSTRIASLNNAKNSIYTFQLNYHRFVNWSDNVRPLLKTNIERLYRDCQNFATGEISRLTSEISFDFSIFNE